MSVSGSLFKRHKRSVVLGDYSASDHSYVLHKFKGLIMPASRGRFRYSTKDIVSEMFVKNFDDRKFKSLGARTGVTENQDSLKRIIEETCEVSLKKVIPPRRSRKLNYWWNNEITRGETLKKRILAQRSRLRNEKCAEQMEAGYKKRGKSLGLLFSGVTGWPGKSSRPPSTVIRGACHIRGS